MWILAVALLAGHPDLPDSPTTVVEAHHVAVAPAESLWVELRGTGHPVVLIPGLVGSRYSYRHVAELLEGAGYRVTVVEPLGVGRSGRPRRADYSLSAQALRIAAVLDSLDVVHALVVSHSIGSAMALRLAYVRPDLVRGLVSLDGGAAESALTADMSGAFLLAPLLRLPGARALVRKKVAGGLRAASGDPAWVTEEVVRAYTADGWSDPGRALAAFQAMATARDPQPLADVLADIRTPVLLLVGGAPKASGLSEAEASDLAVRLPDITVDVLPGVGHYIHEECPGAVADAVVRLDGGTRGGDAVPLEPGRWSCARS
jgi:pimeloyl-ACP methyl ester carboxylesterase